MGRLFVTYANPYLLTRIFTPQLLSKYTSSPFLQVVRILGYAHAVEIRGLFLVRGTSTISEQY